MTVDDNPFSTDVYSTVHFIKCNQHFKNSLHTAQRKAVFKATVATIAKYRHEKCANNGINENSDNSTSRNQ